ncbi:uncharacterized protein TNCV_273081 [Trichonephila clavipes]|nr:uncharacterized protein TNCV_273081 [Trichonephila clavipes]
MAGVPRRPTSTIWRGKEIEPVQYYPQVPTRERPKETTARSSAKAWRRKSKHFIHKEEKGMGAPFLFTPINKSASEIKEITLDARFPKQKNRRVIFQCGDRAWLKSEHVVLLTATLPPQIRPKIGRKSCMENKPKSTVSDVIVKWKRRGSETAERQTGRPKILGERSRRTLKRVVKQNRKSSLAEISQEFQSSSGIGVSKIWDSMVVQPLTPQNSKHRLQWCRAHRHRTCGKLFFGGMNLALQSDGFGGSPVK